MNRDRYRWITLCPGLLLTAALASAADMIRPEPPVAKVETSTLDRCGEGELVAFRLFTVGLGVLWREDCQVPWALDAAEARYMEFRYERDIPAEAFRESARNYLDRNGIVETDALRAFNEAYRDVKAGDTYAIAYRPGEGLELWLNDQQLARLDDEAVARRYFAIWLGDRPFDDSLKMALLGLP